MNERRLDDRIRRLSTEIADAKICDVEALLQDLLAAIHEKLDRLRTRAVNQFLRGESRHERRAAP
jgi:hypothetical protein